MNTLIPVLVLVAIVVLCVSVIATQPKREAKRITQFQSTWETTAKEALERIKVLQDTNRFFSDEDKETFKKRYSQLFSAFQSLPQIKRSDIKELLRVIEDFSAAYQSIDKVQIDNNVAYFNGKTAALPADYANIHAPNVQSSKRFVNHHEVEVFKEKWQEYISQFSSLKSPTSYSRILTFDTLKEVSGLYKDDGLQKQRLQDNVVFTGKELIQKKEYFDTIFKYPLDDQQRRAIICLEDNTLVVSSAGSGKTSTIVGKVRYLVNQRNVSPEDILVVTYTRKAAAELRERMGIEGITSSTFHKHAMDTIGLLTGKKPTIVEPTVMSNIFDDLLNHDASFLKAFNKYISELVNLTKDDNDYPSAAAKSADMQKYGHRSPYKDMNGQFMYVKSKQELQITVILTNLGVDFCYEETYPYDTATTKNRQYKPDFTIHYKTLVTDNVGNRYYQEKVLYYEHFGIDKNGNVPKWFGDGLQGGWAEAQQKYTDGISWKKATHRQNHTDLMVTTSADFSENEDIASYIENLLRKHGVPINPLSEEEKKRRLQEANTKIDETLFRLVSGFITLMKANGKTISGIIQGIKPNDTYGERNKYVLEEIISPVYTRYQAALSKEKSMDFTDVLLEAAELCKKRNPYNYKYILVDEFQDISMDKYAYLKSLRKLSPFSCLFCVGDDWQSIYRFSGSDMTLFYDFANHFGYTQECKIETTHRFGQPLLNASSIFILTNPEQKEKIVKTTADSSTSIRFIPYSSRSKFSDVEDIIKNIPEEESIFILGRYSFNIDSIVPGLSKANDKKEDMYVNFGGRKVRYLTVHSSKGLEADNIIILDCDSGTYGFPSLVSDDPILEYVLSGADSFSNAEERRVFYVAITRARKATYCFFDGRNPSPFMNEFGEFSKYENSTDAICPRCHRGFVRIHKNAKTKYGKPYLTVSCTNTNCDYFETLFDENVYKYKAREAIKSWSLPSFIKAFRNNRHGMYYSNRTYLLINNRGDPATCLPIFIAPNMKANSLLWERIRHNPEDFRVDAYQYYNQFLFVLMKPGAHLYISNGEMDDAIRHVSSAVTESQCRLANYDDLFR